MRFPAALALLCLAACTTPIPAVHYAPWEAVEGMDAPESAYVDPAQPGAVYVSQIGGMPMEKDGNGRISLLTVEGAVAQANWITGLNAPKGLRSRNGILYVADIDELVEIDMAAVKILRKVKIDGAKFLNDPAIGADGTVYVSDTLQSKIFWVKDGKTGIFAEGDDLEYPNGLLVEGDQLVVAGWGKPEADFTTKVPGRLFKLDLKTKKKTLITREPTGNLDGLEIDGKGGYIVTDWMGGKVFHISGDGKVKLLRQMKQGTADHAYLPASKTLILPLMLENKVVSIDLSSDLP